MNLLLSLDTLKRTLLTIVANVKNSNYIYYYNEEEKIVTDNDKLLISKKTKFSKILSDYLNSTDFYHNYRLSPESLSDLKYIVEQCQKNKIDLKVFISPVHASHLEAIRVAGLWSIFETWKREVSNITKMWDFADYHNIATEVITEDMIYFTDSIHYTRITGKLIMNQIFSKSIDSNQNNFGTLVDSSNIEEHLSQVSQNRQNWIKNNLELYDWVASLKN